MRVDTLKEAVLAWVQNHPGITAADVQVNIRATRGSAPRSRIEQALYRLSREGKIKFVGPRRSGGWQEVAHDPTMVSVGRRA